VPSARGWARALLLAAGALASAARAGDPLLSERLSGFSVAAHRGGYWHADSNTLVRFETARAEGADIIETDLQVSSDGVPFLFHDERLDNATRCHGLISRTPARVVETCRLKGLGHGPERFESALQWSHGRVVIDAELKSPASVRPAIDLIRRYGAYEWVYLQVGDGLRLYRGARSYDRYVALEAVLTGPDGLHLLETLLSYGDPRLISIQLHGDMLSSENVRLIHEHRTRVTVDAFRLGLEWRWGIWPFRRVAACTQLFRDGVDIAVSNVPASCARQRETVANETGRIRQVDLPDAVRDAVRTTYPGARITRFERETEEGERCYEVGLDLAGTKLEASFSGHGQLVEEEHAIEASELPAKITRSLAASRYVGWTVKRAERVLSKEHAPPHFEILVVEQEGQGVELLMDEAGAIQRESPKQIQDDDDDR